MTPDVARGSALTPRGPGLVSVLANLRRLFAPARFESAVPNLPAQRFRERGGRRRADVYLPAGDGPHPTVILVHGGGWVIGHRRMKPMRYLATELVRAGYGVVVGDYRTVLRGGRIGTMVDDVVAKIAWAQARPEVDPARLHIVGLSAGGTLSLLAAARYPAGTFRRVVSVFGAYDLHDLERGPLTRLLRPLVVGSRDRLAGWSPFHGALPGAPLTMLHGTHDDLVPMAQAEAFHARCLAAGHDIEFVRYDGAGHGFFNDVDDPFCARGVQDLLRVLGS